MTYFALHSPGHPVEIARLNGRGRASIYEPESSTWINDPLLATEIRHGGGWKPIAPHELPAGVLPNRPQESTPAPRRHRRRWNARANQAPH